MSPADLKSVNLVLVFSQQVCMEKLARSCGLVYNEDRQFLPRFVSTFYLEEIAVNPVPYQILRVQVKVREGESPYFRIPTDMKAWARCIFVEHVDRLEEVKNAGFDVEQRLWQLIPYLPQYTGPLWSHKMPVN